MSNGSHVVVRNGTNDVTLPLAGQTIGQVRSNEYIADMLALRNASYAVEVYDESGNVMSNADSTVIEDGWEINFVRAGGTKG